MPFCYGVALVDRDYCSLPVDGATTSGGPVVRHLVSRLAATAVAVGFAVMVA